ncbi:MAG TPA: DNA-processing protein DprA [Candidatus Saccharimonadales bacterium]|nr:DNA-processing protein DprA [Candidatus Saccharimonadales bacterium]
MRVNSLKHDDPDFPQLLRHIPSPPRQLFWLGAHPRSFLDKPRVAVVGSRQASSYGAQVTERLVSALAKAGLVIVSGLALGVDSIAHTACLRAGGLTIAVLPSGLDQIYPASHLALAKQIVERGGCLISEYPPGAQIYRSNFIARNRLISGLADGLLITEAAKGSGTMHTASFALEQGRSVMAVPGNINSLGSEGCNSLIKNGALPVTSVDDVLAELGIGTNKPKGSRAFRSGPNEQKIFDLIRSGIGDQQQLAAAARLNGSQLGAALRTLEINGYIRAESGSWSLK